MGLWIQKHEAVSWQCWAVADRICHVGVVPLGVPRVASAEGRGLAAANPEEDDWVVFYPSQEQEERIDH